MTGAESLETLPRGLGVPRARLYVDRLAVRLSELLRAGWRWIQITRSAMRARSERRSLRVAESVSLGDKRAVYLVEVDGQRLLLGASAAGVTLLSQLPPQKEAWQSAVKDLVFADVMEDCEGKKPPKRKTTPKNSAKAAE